MTGKGDTFIVGGVEHMGHVGMMHGIDLNPAASKHYAKASNMMGLTAEMLGRMNNMSREEQDAFGLVRIAALGQRLLGRFDNEIIGIEGHDARSRRYGATVDEVIRPDATMEQMQKLRPAI